MRPVVEFDKPVVGAVNGGDLTFDLALERGQDRVGEVGDRCGLTDGHEDRVTGPAKPRETPARRDTAWLPRAVRNDPNVIVITDVWDRLEEVALDIGRMLGYSNREARDVTAVVDNLSEHGLVAAEMSGIASGLNSLRHSLLFSDELVLPSWGIAENFGYAADNLLEALEGVRHRLNAELYPAG